MIVTRNIVRHMEYAAAEFIKNFSKASKILYPKKASDYLNINGGIAAFVQDNPWMTRTLALDCTSPVTKRDLGKIEDFYFSYDFPSVIEMAGLSDPEIFTFFGEQGYKSVEIVHHLVLNLETWQPARYEHQYDIYRAESEDDDIFIDIVFDAISDEADIKENMRKMYKTFFTMLERTGYLVKSHNSIVGCGSITEVNNIATLCGAVTYKNFQKRGIHQELIQYRLRIAKELGCEYAVIVGLPLSTTQRNAERAGLQNAYSSVVFIKEKN